ncbi:MAG: 50S ribosomal protein L31 [Gemmatimonadetes bacterium]|nr:50S ribosomal protein L31 [Gemmatimonadota bacterium]
MKKEIHPEYRAVVFQDISTDFQVLTRSTMTSEAMIEWEDGKSYPLVRVEISSASHPFYTGKRQLIADRGGRIEQFRRRYNIKDSEGETGEDSAAAEAASSGDAAES